jgi:hypothetical protein
LSHGDVRATAKCKFLYDQGETTLSVPYWGTRFREESWKASRHRLENLCLTDWNSHYLNKGFNLKKGNPDAPTDMKVYRNSRWRQERELADFKEWTEVEIETRQRRLADFALARWGV